jgi:hypothetical protein
VAIDQFVGAAAHADFIVAIGLLLPCIEQRNALFELPLNVPAAFVLSNGIAYVLYKALAHALRALQLTKAAGD